MQVDFQKESGVPIYPKGTYKVLICKWERGESKDKKTPQIKWTAEVQVPLEHAGRPMQDFTSLTEAALWKVVKLIQGCGIDTSKLKKIDTNSRAFENILNHCINRTSYWYVEDKTTPSGKLVNDVKSYIVDKEQPIIEPAETEDVKW